MDEVGAYEAKTRFSQLLEQVTQGKEIGRHHQTRGPGSSPGSPARLPEKVTRKQSSPPSRPSDGGVG